MKFLLLLAAGLLLTRGGFAAALPVPTVDERSVKICVAADATPEIREAAGRVLAGVGTQPLLRVLAGAHPPAALTESGALLAGPTEEAAYHHLVLVGLPADPLIRAASLHEARVAGGGEVYCFGFGHLQGDLALPGADRNPFLHSRFIPRAPYETELVILTGNTPAGVVLAVDSFLRTGLVNGVVARPGWTRSQPNLLQRDPLPAGFTPPDWLPERAGAWTRIALSYGAEDEARGVLSDTGLEPLEIWRAKYYQPGVWDGAGAASAFANFHAGLQTRASGNTLWLARFASEGEALSAAPKIAAAASLQVQGPLWTGRQPPFGNDKESPGPLTLARRGAWLLMSTVPEPALLQIP